MKQVIDSDGCVRCLRDRNHPLHEESCKGGYTHFRTGKRVFQKTDCPRSECSVKMKGKEVNLNKRICFCALERKKQKKKQEYKKTSPGGKPTPRPRYQARINQQSVTAQVESDDEDFEPSTDEDSENEETQHDKTSSPRPVIPLSLIHI